MREPSVERAVKPVELPVGQEKGVKLLAHVKSVQKCNFAVESCLRGSGLLPQGQEVRVL